MEEELVKLKSRKKLSILPFYKRIGFEYPVYVRKSVADKLYNVADTLPNEYYLQIDSGYRTLKSQKQIWLERFKQFSKQNPSLTDREVSELTDKLVYNPKHGTPPHTTGGAVDVSLLDNNKKEINLSEPFHNFYDEPQLKSNKISEQAQILRLTLNEMMLKYGFAPHPKEYWHFSYGDKIWAEYCNKEIIYKQIDKLPYKMKPNALAVKLRRLLKFLYRKKRYLTKRYKDLVRL